MKRLSVLLVLIFVSGCATAHKISKVQLGMTKNEVIQVMGPPDSISAKGNIEYLNYQLQEFGIDNRLITRPYYVRILEGRVDSFGRLGDFDSTQKPTVRLETEENINTQSDVKKSGESDLFSELRKLKELRDEGLITQEEFEMEKKEILEKY